MKLLLLTLFITQLSYATCTRYRTICTPSSKIQNQYLLIKVACSAPISTGRYYSESTRLQIFSPLLNNKVIFEKELTKDIAPNDINYFYAKLDYKGLENPTLEIIDNSTSSERNINVSTSKDNPLKLAGYKCKFLFGR